jgi:hypothetical protein
VKFISILGQVADIFTIGCPLPVFLFLSASLGWGGGDISEYAQGKTPASDQASDHLKFKYCATTNTETTDNDAVGRAEVNAATMKEPPLQQPDLVEVQ